MWLRFDAAEFGRKRYVDRAFEKEQAAAAFGETSKKSVLTVPSNSFRTGLSKAL